MNQELLGYNKIKTKMSKALTLTAIVFVALMLSVQSVHVLQWVDVSASSVANQPIAWREEILNELNSNFDGSANNLKQWVYMNEDDRRAIDRETILNAINAERAVAGAQALVLDNTLNHVSQLHSEDMRDRDYFSHTTLGTGESPGDRAQKEGFNDPVGENIAISSSADQAHVQFRNSPGHYANYMNGTYQRLGLGIAYKFENGFKQLYVTEMFSPPAVQPPSGGSSSPITAHSIETIVVPAVLEVNGNSPTFNQGLAQDLQNALDNGPLSQLFTHIFGLNKYYGYFSYTYYPSNSDTPEGFADEIRTHSLLGGPAGYG